MLDTGLFHLVSYAFKRAGAGIEMWLSGDLYLFNVSWVLGYLDH